MTPIKKYLIFQTYCGKMYEHLISLGPYGWVHCRKIDIEADGPLAFML
jgi:hypothetical protein